jgi:hypothetical protein
MTAPTLTSKPDRESLAAKARFAHNIALKNALRAKLSETAISGRSFLLGIRRGTNEICRMLTGWKWSGV